MNAPEVDAAALRRLARGLVFDTDVAGDVVQEAWLAALRRDPEAVPAQSWLAGAVKRIALGRRRAATRRHAREALAARPEPAHASEDVPERLEVLRTLLAALERLDEPYRAAVVMRYLDDLPPREIARRTGVPVDTARTHVRRGLERLRRDLDGPQGRGREALLGALGPWFAHEFGDSAMSAASSWIGAPSMKLALTIVLAVIGGVFGWRLLRDSSSPALEPLALASTLDEGVVAGAAEVPAEATAEASQDEGDARVAVSSTATYEVTGVVLRDALEPLPGGHVIVRARRGVGLAGELLHEQRVRADTGGVFRAMLEPFGETVTVEVEQDEPGHWGHTNWLVVPSGDASWGPWAIYASPLDLDVSGRVIDEHGAGIAGARVVQESYFCERAAMTDDDGRFSLRMSSRQSPSELIVEATGFGRARTMVHVHGTTSMEVAPIELSPEARVEGRVADESGRPIAGARVLRASFSSTAWSTSDEQGRFVLAGIDPGARKPWIRVEHPDFAPLGQSVETFDAPTEVTLHRGATLSGRVRTSSGAPISNAWLRLGTTGDAGNEPGTATDDQGRFHFEHVSPELANLWIWAQGHANTRHHVPLGPGVEMVEGIEITLQPQRVLRGTLLDDTGTPVAWGMVFVEETNRWNPEPDFDSTQVRSDAKGRFVVSGLPSGPLVVGAAVSGFARLEMPLSDANDADLELRLQPGASVAGRVVDASTGQPIPQFRVVVSADWNAPAEHRLKYGPKWSDGIAISDPEGAWRMDDDIPADRWVHVEVAAEGYAPARVERLATAVDPDPAACVVALVRQTLVRGLVVDLDGAPVVGAVVSLVGRKGGPRATTDGAGRFELRGLAAGETTLAVEAEGFARLRDGPFEVGGTPLQHRIQLDRGARVMGRVLGDAGLPMEGQQISLWGYDGNDRDVSRKTASDAEGRFAFTGLALGTFDLHLERTLDGETWTAQSRRVDVTALEDVEANLGASGSAVLHATIQSEVALPPGTRVRVMFMAEPDPKRMRVGGTESHRFSVAESSRTFYVEGDRFEIRGLEPGRYMLSGRAELDATTTLSGLVRQIEITAGQQAEVEVLLKAPPR